MSDETRGPKRGECQPEKKRGKDSKKRGLITKRPPNKKDQNRSKPRRARGSRRKILQWITHGKYHEGRTADQNMVFCMDRGPPGWPEEAEFFHQKLKIIVGRTNTKVGGEKNPVG